MWSVTGNPKGCGVCEAKVFKGMYEAKVTFPEGWGTQIKEPSVTAVWIFSETTQF